MKVKVTIAVSCVLVNAYMTGCTHAAEEPPRRDPEAVALLQRAKAYYATLPAWSAQVNASAVGVSKTGGRLTEIPCVGSYAVARPDKFAVRYPDEPASCTSLISNGKTFWISMHMPPGQGVATGSRYSAHPAKVGFTSLERPGVPNMEYAMNARSVMSSLPGGGLFDEPLEAEEQSILLLKTSEAGTRTVRVVFVESVMDFTFAEGDKPWLMRFREDYDAWIDMRQRAGLTVPPDPIRGSDMVEFSGWTTTVDPKVFEFVPPIGAKKMGDITSDFWEAAIKKLPKPELVGKATPAATVGVLNGKKQTIEEVRGGGVLVIDFWATWCGPCIISLPEVTGVTKEFEGQNVRMLAVNIGESEEKVRTAVVKRQWTMPIGLDEDKSVAQAFGVKAVPQTFVIDKAGKVHAVFSGAIPDLETKLRAAITEALR